MTPEIFVSKVRDAVVEQNDEIDKQLFETTSVESATDPYWKRALSLYNSLNQEKQSILFEIIHQVRVDALSECLGILDGVCSLDEPTEDFILTVKPNGLRLNGSLQEIFLEADERTRSD